MADAGAMRRILVELARRKKRIKRNGGFEHVSKEDIEVKAPMPVPVSSLNSQGFILRSSAASF